MKIKGIAGKNNPGLKKGDPIPLSPEEKACLVAADIIIKESDNVWKNIPVKKEILGKVQVTKGRKDIKNPEPDQYKATVKVTYKKYDLQRERLFTGNTATIKILFEDSKDDLGLPDFKITKQDFL